MIRRKTIIGYIFTLIAGLLIGCLFYYGIKREELDLFVSMFLIEMIISFMWWVGYGLGANDMIADINTKFVAIITEDNVDEIMEIEENK